MTPKVKIVVEPIDVSDKTFKSFRARWKWQVLAYQDVDPGRSYYNEWANPFWTFEDAPGYASGCAKTEEKALKAANEYIVKLKQRVMDKELHTIRHQRLRKEIPVDLSD